MKEGFDVGLEMSGNPAAFRDMVENMSHGGKHRACSGIPEEPIAIDWNTVDLRTAHDQRHLRPGDVRDLVQDDGDAAERPRHRAGDHAPFPGDRFEEAFAAIRTGETGKVLLHWIGRASDDRDRPAGARGRARGGSGVAGLEKPERVLTSPQRARVGVRGRERRGPQPLREQLPRARRPPRGDRGRARPRWSEWGYGLASVRFICGTQELHKDLEDALSAFLGTEDTILYGSCFDANGGLFETLLGEEDAVISDELNHASIIDGVRLCQGEAVPLPQQRHGRPRDAAEGGGRRADAADRDRRRVLDGRLHRQPRRRSATWPSVTTRW